MEKYLIIKVTLYLKMNIWMLLEMEKEKNIMMAYKQMELNIILMVI